MKLTLAALFLAALATSVAAHHSAIAEYDLEKSARAVLISPAWGLIDLTALANWIAESGLNVRMQLQLHKYIWGPDVQGV